MKLVNRYIINTINKINRGDGPLKHICVVALPCAPCTIGECFPKSQQFRNVTEQLHRSAVEANGAPECHLVLPDFSKFNFETNDT